MNGQSIGLPKKPAKPIFIPKQGNGVTLRNGDLFLNLGHTALTSNKRYAWRGTIKQAQRVMKQSPFELSIGNDINLKRYA
jgi:hypothetical protein